LFKLVENNSGNQKYEIDDRFYFVGAFETHGFPVIGVDTREENGLHFIARRSAKFQWYPNGCQMNSTRFSLGEIFEWRKIDKRQLRSRAQCLQKLD
jgi:hypothetical protein